MTKEFVRIFFAFLKLCPAFYYYYVPVLAAPCLKSTTTRRFATFNLHTHQLNKKKQTNLLPADLIGCDVSRSRK